MFFSQIQTFSLMNKNFRTSGAVKVYRTSFFSSCGFSLNRRVTLLPFQEFKCFLYFVTGCFSYFSKEVFTAFSCYVRSEIFYILQRYNTQKCLKRIVFIFQFFEKVLFFLSWCSLMFPTETPKFSYILQKCLSIAAPFFQFFQ